MTIAWRVVLEPVTPLDRAAVDRLLAECGLPTEDIDEHFSNFIVVRRAGVLCGVIGLQSLGRIGLLRSLAVRNPDRHGGLGTALCARMLEAAGARGVARLYLLTTTAGDFFRARGFAPVERASVPPEVQATREYAVLCPETAQVLARDL